MSGETAFFKAVADFSSLVRQSQGGRRALKSLEAQAHKTDAAVAKVKMGTGLSEAEMGLLAGLPGLLAKATQAQKTSTQTTTQATTAHSKLASAHQAVAKAAKEHAASERQIAKDLKLVGQNANNGVGGLLSMAVQLGFVKSSVIAVTAAVAALTAGGAALGLQFNATIEQLQVAFTTVLGDAAKADDALARIVETARVTPFETTDLAQGVRMLLNYGFTMDQVLKGAGNEASGLAISLGNAVAAAGGGREVLTGVFRAVGQIQTKGKASAEELRQLAEQGIPAYKILQEELGLTGEQVANIGDEGITAEKAINALQTGLDKRFGGAMEAQSKTMVGLLSTFKDNVVIGAGAVFKGLFDQAKGALTTVNDFIQDLVLRTQDVGFAQAMREKLPGLMSLVDQLAATFRSVWDVLSALGPVASGFIKTLSSTALLTFVAGMQVLRVVLTTIAAIINSIPESMREFIGGALALSLALNKLTGPIRLLKTMGSSLQYVYGVLKAIAAARGASALTAVVGSLKTTGTEAVASARKAGGLVSVVAGLGPAGWAATAGILAAGAAMYYFAKQGEKAREANINTAEAADMLGKLVKKSAEAASDGMGSAGDAATKAAQKAKEAEEAFDNATLPIIERLEKLDEAAARRYLIQVGINLVNDGGDPQSIKELLDQLAAKSGLQVDIEVGDFSDVDSQLKAMADDGKAFGDALARANGLGDRMKDNLSGFAGTIADSFATGDIEKGIALYAKFEGAARSAYDKARPMAEKIVGDGNAFTEAEANAIHFKDAMGYLGDEVAKAYEKITGKDLEISISSIDDLPTFLDELSRSATGAAPQLRAQATELRGLAAEARKTGDWTQYYTRVAGVMGEQTAENKQRLQEMGQEMADNEAKTQALADSAEKWADVLKDVGGTLQTDTAGQAFATLLDGVSDAQKEAAESAAKNAGLGADAWEQFATDSITALEDFNNYLKAQIANQANWQANLTEVARRFGPDVAEQLAKMGPQAAGIVAQMVDDTTGEAEQLAGNLRYAALISGQAYTEGLASYWQVASQLSSQGATATAQSVADALGTTKEQVLAILATYGDDAERKWAALETVGSEQGGAAADALSDALSRGEPQAVAELESVLNRLRALVPTTLATTTIGVTIGRDIPQQKRNIRALKPGERPTSGPYAQGGIDVAARGGVFGNSLSAARTLETYGRGGYKGPFLPEEAVIAPPAGSDGAVQWRERSTRGEAFLPLNKDPKQLARTRSIWMTVGRMLNFINPDLAMALDRRRRRREDLSGKIQTGMQSYATGGVFYGSGGKPNLDYATAVKLGFPSIYPKDTDWTAPNDGSIWIWTGNYWRQRVGPRTSTFADDRRASTSPVPARPAPAPSRPAVAAPIQRATSAASSAAQQAAAAVRTGAQRGTGVSVGPSAADLEKFYQGVQKAQEDRAKEAEDARKEAEKAAADAWEAQVKDFLTQAKNRRDYELERMAPADRKRALEDRLNFEINNGRAWADEAMDIRRQLDDVNEEIARTADDLAKENDRRRKNQAEYEAEKAGPAAQKALYEAELAKLIMAGEGWTDEAMDLRSKIDSAGQEIADALEEQADKVRSEIQDTQDRLKKVTDAIGQYQDQRAQAEKQARESVENAGKSLADSIDSTTKNVMQSLNPLEAFKPDRAPSGQMLVRNLTRQNKAFGDLNSGLDQLRARGISQDAIDSLGLADVKNLGVVQSLLKSPNALAQINSLIANRKAQAGKLAADYLSSEAKARYDEEVKGIWETMAEDIANLKKDLADAIAEAMKADPSKALEGKSVAELQALLAQAQADYAAAIAQAQGLAGGTLQTGQEAVSSLISNALAGLTGAPVVAAVSPSEMGKLTEQSVAMLEAQDAQWRQLVAQLGGPQNLAATLQMVVDGRVLYETVQNYRLTDDRVAATHGGDVWGS